MRNFFHYKYFKKLIQPTGYDISKYHKDYPATYSYRCAVPDDRCDACVAGARLPDRILQLWRRRLL